MSVCWAPRSRADRALSEDHPLTRATCSRTGATGPVPPMRSRRCSGSPRRSIWCRSTARKSVARANTRSRPLGVADLCAGELLHGRTARQGRQDRLRGAFGLGVGGLGAGRGAVAWNVGARGRRRGLASRKGEDESENGDHGQIDHDAPVTGTVNAARQGSGGRQGRSP